MMYITAESTNEGKPTNMTHAPHFHAGHNDAGYLPESDVVLFATFADAKQYQIDELLRAADSIGSWSEEHDCDDIPCPTFGDECPDQLANAVALEAEELNLESGPAWDTYLSDGRSLPVHWWISSCSDDCHDEDSDDCACSECEAGIAARIAELQGLGTWVDRTPDESLELDLLKQKLVQLS